MIDRTPATITPQFDVSILGSDEGTLVFDAIRPSFGPAGPLGAAQGTFVWDFGDGTLATGGVVQHSYARPGDYLVTLTFTQPDGTATPVSETVRHLPLDMVRLDRQTGQFGVTTDTGENMLAVRAGAAIGAVGRKVIDLGGTGALLTIPREMIAGIFKADNFQLDLQLRADGMAPSRGEVFRLNGTFLGAVGSNGAFSFSVWTETGASATLTGRGTNILDGRMHDISIRYDTDLGVVRLLINGQLAAEAPLSGDLPPMSSHGLTFGNPWGGLNFNGFLSHFDLNVERSGYAEYDGSTPPVPSALAPILPPGTSLPDPDAPAIAITPLFAVSALPTDGSILVFDAASYSTGNGGPLPPDQGQFIWTFGDGTFAMGGVVQHRYATLGTYAVTLSFVQPYGTATSVFDTVDRLPADVLRLDSGTGRFAIATDSGETLLAANAGTVIGATGAKVIDLGGTGTTATIPRGLLGAVFTADNFQLDLQLRTDLAPNAWGEVFRLHGTMMASVRSSGDMQFSLWTESGTLVNLFSKGVNLLDGKAHDISIRYDADLGRVSLVVDGAFTTEAAMSGNLPKAGSWDMTFGNPWGGQNFNGYLSRFDLDIERGGYPDYAGATPPIPAEIAALAPQDVPAAVPDTYLLNDAAMQALRPDQLMDGARLETAGSQTVLALDGPGAVVALGVVDAFRDADQIAFALDFQRAAIDMLDASLVANAGQIALGLQGDGLQLKVATATEGFKSYQIAGLGLQDTNRHEAVVLFDAAGDRLQVFLDDRLVFEDFATDLVMTTPEGAPIRGWTLGENLAGNIAAFAVTEDLSHPVATGDVGLFA